MSREASTGKVVEVSLRVPGRRPPPSEDEIQRLEEVAEARGNGIAGQLPPVAQIAPRAVPAVESPKAPEPMGGRQQARGIVERKGRILADGSRKGKRNLRRVTVYLRPELAKKLTRHCSDTETFLSDFVGDAVEAKFARKG